MKRYVVLLLHYRLLIQNSIVFSWGRRPLGLSVHLSGQDTSAIRTIIRLSIAERVLLPAVSLALNLGILNVLLDVKFVLFIVHELRVTLDVLKVGFQIENLVLLAGVLLF